MARWSLAALVLLAVAGCSASDRASAPGAPSDGAPPAAASAPPPAANPAPPRAAVTTIRVHYAGEPGEISLRGSTGPLSWDTGATLAHDAPALWVWSSPDVTAPTEFKPMLDGAWSRGPNYHVAPGQTVDVYPRFVEAHGSVTKMFPAFTSTKLPSTRGVWVYLPPTYLENTEARFGVLYMHDGQNLFSAETAFGGNEWEVDEALDAGAEDGTIRETIVVGVENTADRIDELTPTASEPYGGGEADSYLAMITDEIKPKIDAELRTLPGRASTAVMGSSLGGLVSAYAGVRRADVFGLVGAMSPSTWWDDRMILGEVASLATRPVRPLRVYVDSGDSGPSHDDVANTNDLAAEYESVGYVSGKDFEHVVAPGAEHNEISWAARLPAALRFLLGPRPN